MLRISASMGTPAPSASWPLCHSDWLRVSDLGQADQELGAGPNFPPTPALKYLSRLLHWELPSSTGRIQLPPEQQVAPNNSPFLRPLADTSPAYFTKKAVALKQPCTDVCGHLSAACACARSPGSCFTSSWSPPRPSPQMQHASPLAYAKNQTRQKSVPSPASRRRLVSGFATDATRAAP